MASTSDKKPGPVALLSVAGLTDGQASGGNVALLEVGGRPLLARQMLALRRVGVDVFAIEVDNVPGVLLDLADGFRRSGARVEFVRTAKDLRPFLSPGSKLVVQAEGHYFSAAVIEELLGQPPVFVATIDSRDENAGFERIDLNTRWAGFALLDASTALAMTELPEGWSITSSLLRHAIQSGAKLRALPQNCLQRGEVLRITTPADAAALGSNVLSERAGRAPGWIERHVFGAIAARLAPATWRSRSSAKLVDFAGPILAGVSLGLGTFGFSLPALIAGFFALFARQTSEVAQDTKDDAQPGSWRDRLFWALLVAGAIAVAWAERGYLADTPSFMVIALGIALLVRKLSLRRWSTGLLQSPALLTVLMLIAMLLSLFPQGVKAIVFAQLALLLTDRYLPAGGDKNNNHA